MSEISSKINILGIIGLLGAIIALIGVFLNWVDVTISIPFVGENTESLIGWDIFSDSGDDKLDYYYAPLVTLIFGIVAIIAGVLPLAMPGSAISKPLGFVSLAIGIITIIIMIMFMNSVSDSAEIFGASATVSVAYGFWMGVAGAAITVIGGIANIVKK